MADSSNPERVKRGLLFLAAAVERLDKQDFGSLRRTFMTNPQQHADDLKAVEGFIKGVKQQVYDLMPSRPKQIEAPTQGKTWHDPEDEEDDD